MHRLPFYLMVLSYSSFPSIRREIKPPRLPMVTLVIPNCSPFSRRQWISSGKSTGLEAKRPGSRLSQTAMRMDNYVPSLGLSLLICKMTCNIFVVIKFHDYPHVNACVSHLLVDPD